jgi:hypothetical protein
MKSSGDPRRKPSAEILAMSVAARLENRFALSTDGRNFLFEASAFLSSRVRVGAESRHVPFACVPETTRTRSTQTHAKGAIHQG